MSSFSEIFAIDTTALIENGKSTTITNPGQAFTLIGVFVSGVAANVITVKKNTTGGAQAAVATVITAGSSFNITPANQDFLSTDNIFLVASGGAGKDATKVTLICRSAVASTWKNTPPA